MAVVDQQISLVRQASPQNVRSSDIVVIAFDEETIRQYEEPIGLWHRHLGKVFEGVAKASPRAVVLDYVLPDRSYNQFLNEDFDAALGRGLISLRKSTTLIVARGIQVGSNSKAGEYVYRSVLPLLASTVRPENFASTVLTKDIDGIVRRIPSMGTSAAGLITKLANSLEIEVEDGLINFLTARERDYIPFHEIERWVDSANKTKLEEELRGKVVFFGAVLPDTDRHTVPIPLFRSESDTRKVPGVVVLAEAFQTLSDGETIKRSGFVAFLLLLAIISVVWWLGSSVKMQIIASLCSILALYVFSAGLLTQGVWIPIGGLIAVVTLFSVLKIAIQGYANALDKKRLTSVFSGYVSPGVMAEIESGSWTENSRGDYKSVCVLFSDIRGFTTRSEGQTADSVINLLNRYFEQMTIAVHSHGGTVDKFIGDGLMAFFGAPNALENPSQSAFHAAREMLANLEMLNADLKLEGVAPIEIGIGLHYGRAIVGHVGSIDRHEYSAIGDTVNIAARLEGIAKHSGKEIVCTEAVCNTLGCKLEDLGVRELKGRASIRVFGWPVGN